MYTRRMLVNIEATPNCPARCSMCPRELVQDRGFMDVSIMERIIEQIDPSYVWEVDLAGRGEPTIHPQFEQLLTVMRRTKVPTCVVTTGAAFNARTIQACATNLDVIRLSVSSVHRETFEAVHMGLDHEKVWRNIAQIASTAAGKVVVHLTGGPAIHRDLPDTVAALRRLGLNRIYLMPLWNRGGGLRLGADAKRRDELMARLNIQASENEYVKNSSRLSRWLRTVHGKIRNSDYCSVGDCSVSIGFRGDIVACFQDFRHSCNLGHISQDSLRCLLDARLSELGRMPICAECNSRQRMSV